MTDGAQSLNKWLPRQRGVPCPARPPEAGVGGASATAHRRQHPQHSTAQFVPSHHSKLSEAGMIDTDLKTGTPRYCWVAKNGQAICPAGTQGFTFLACWLLRCRSATAWVLADRSMIDAHQRQSAGHACYC